MGGGEGQGVRGAKEGLRDEGGRGGRWGGGVECKDNVRKEKYICTIFSVLITLYMNSRLCSFHDLMVFMIIVFLNTQENNFKRKKVSKIAP